MCKRRTSSVAAVLVVLGMSVPGSAARWPEAYWNVSFDGQPAHCRSISKKEQELLAYFEQKNRVRCSQSDEGDHLLFRCGEIHEVIAFSRESCMLWAKAPMSQAQERRMVAFDRCVVKAKAGVGIDAAIPYCSCNAERIVAFSEEQIGAMSIVEIQKIAYGCARATGIRLAQEGSDSTSSGSPSSDAPTGRRGSHRQTEPNEEDRYQRVCRMVQRFGKRVHGMSTEKAALFLARRMADFSESDFRLLANRSALVRCMEPQTLALDNCTFGTIVRFQGGQPCK